MEKVVKCEINLGVPFTVHVLELKLQRENQMCEVCIDGNTDMGQTQFPLMPSGMVIKNQQVQNVLAGSIN
jgi:hypothetical protein